MLFINADRDYHAGRAQNHLRPRDEEKITAAYHSFADVDGFARVVNIEELAENDFNCNIRRYADNSPPPEPHDVRAHLHGDVPMTEINATKELHDQAGLDAALLFADRGDGYAEWCHDITSSQEREAAHGVIGDAVSQRAAASPWPQWWNDTVEPMLRNLPRRDSLAGVRQELVEKFTARMTADGMGRFEAAGISATWWQESFYELKTAASRGWKAVIEAWLTTTEASQDDNNAPNLADQAVVKLLAGPQLASRSELAAALADLNAEIKAAATASNNDGAADANIPSPAEIKKMKSESRLAKTRLRTLDASLLDTARDTLNAMEEADAPAEAIGVLRDRIEKLVDDHFAEIQRKTDAWYDNLIDKYGTTLGELEAERDAATARLQEHLERLGYG